MLEKTLAPYVLPGIQIIEEGVFFVTPSSIVMLFFDHFCSLHSVIRPEEIPKVLEISGERSLIDNFFSYHVY